MRSWEVRRDVLHRHLQDEASHVGAEGVPHGPCLIAARFEFFDGATCGFVLTQSESKEKLRSQYTETSQVEFVAKLQDRTFSMCGDVNAERRPAAKDDCNRTLPDYVKSSAAIRRTDPSEGGHGIRLSYNGIKEKRSCRQCLCESDTLILIDRLNTERAANAWNIADTRPILCKYIGWNKSRRQSFPADPAGYESYPGSPIDGQSSVQHVCAGARGALDFAAFRGTWSVTQAYDWHEDREMPVVILRAEKYALLPYG